MEGGGERGRGGAGEDGRGEARGHARGHCGGPVAGLRCIWDIQNPVLLTCLGVSSCWNCFSISDLRLWYITAKTAAIVPIAIH